MAASCTVSSPQPFNPNPRSYLARGICTFGRLADAAAVVPLHLLMPALHAAEQRQTGVLRGGRLGGGKNWKSSSKPPREFYCTPGMSSGGEILLHARRQRPSARLFQQPPLLGPQPRTNLWSGMTAEVRVTIPDTEMSLLMSEGLRSRITLTSRRLKMRACGAWRALDRV